MLDRGYEALLAGDSAAAGRLDPLDVLASIEAEAATLPVWRHPLGFIHVELTERLDIPAGQRLRFHIWDSDEGTRDDLGDLHDHVWHLTSWVLVGGLVDSTYTPVAREGGEFVGSRIKYGVTNISNFAGNYDLELVVKRHVAAGMVYTIPSGVVHKSVVGTVPSATLLLSIDDSAAVDRGPLVLSPAAGTGDATARRTKLTTNQLVAAIQQLRSALRAREAE